MRIDLSVNSDFSVIENSNPVKPTAIVLLVTIPLVPFACAELHFGWATDSAALGFPITSTFVEQPSA